MDNFCEKCGMRPVKAKGLCNSCYVTMARKKKEAQCRLCTKPIYEDHLCKEHYLDVFLAEEYSPPSKEIYCHDLLIDLKMMRYANAGFINVDKKHLRQAILAAMETLTVKEKRVLLFRFFYNYTWEQTAEMVDLGTHRVAQIESIALEKLRQPHRWE